MGEAQYFFVSDTHLGLKYADSKERERRFVSFLNSLPKETTGLYLLGDIFDFWIEYRNVVPRGFVRVLGELARLCDEGVEVYFLKGNHDYWTTDYLKNEIGLKVIDEPYIIKNIEGKTFCLGHGDGLGKSDFSYKLMSFLFRDKYCLSALKMLHPRWLFDFAQGWSLRRRSKYEGNYYFRGKDDPIFRFADQLGRDHHIDYYIFGHLHSPAKIAIPSGGVMYILGDWMKNDYYLNFSGMNISGGSFPKIEK